MAIRNDSIGRISMERGTDITKLFKEKVVNHAKGISEENIYGKDKAQLIKFISFAYKIMCRPRIYKTDILDDSSVDYSWTAGRQFYPAIHSVADFANIDEKGKDIRDSLLLYKNCDLYYSFFKYMLELTRKRAMEKARKDMNIYRHQSHYDYNDYNYNTFTHDISYICIDDVYIEIDFILNSKNGSYTIFTSSKTTYC